MQTSNCDYNKKTLESIAYNGILTKAYLEKNNINYQGSNDGFNNSSQIINRISVYVIKKPIETPPIDWITKSIKELIHHPATGTYPLVMERDKFQKEFYNLPENDFVEEVTQRINNSIVFVLNPNELPTSNAKGIGRDYILSQSSYSKGEMFLDGTIPSKAIIHLFIPQAIQNIAQPIFSQYPITYVSEISMTLPLIIPSDIEVDQKLLDLESAFFLKFRKVNVSIPDYQTSINEFAQQHFKIENQTPLIFHTTRLITQWLVKKNDQNNN